MTTYQKKVVKLYLESISTKILAGEIDMVTALFQAVQKTPAELLALAETHRQEYRQELLDRMAGLDGAKAALQAEYDDLSEPIT